MLNLPEVTLMGIDCFTAEKTWLAMRESMRWVKFGKVILATDMQKYGPNSFFNAAAYNVKFVHRKHSTEKKSILGVPPLPVDYEMDVLRLPAELIETDFMLFMEWDSGVLNPDGWLKDFYRFDYIGAPWPDHHDHGWPPCNASNNVGNGGFCLKSRKFVNLVREATELSKGDQYMLSSDRWQCRTIRPWLEDRGIKFAPEELASRFSIENRLWCGSFGFHGRVTAELNNWGGRWLGNIRPKNK